VFPHVDLFDRVVAENGALLVCPAERKERALAEPPPEELVAALRRHGVTPLSVGRAIIATWHPYETVVLETIEQLGLEHQVIFNKGAVMVLPPGVNKASGLGAALSELGLSPHNVVGVGDAENDHAFLRTCECAVAVANALPTLKEQADIVTAHDHAAGVIELVDQIIADDLRSFESRLKRPRLVLGTGGDDRQVEIEPLVTNVLIAGTSGVGKSTVATAILEQLAHHRYQFCLIDPEGDYGAFADAVVLGDTDKPPTEEEVIGLLDQVQAQAIVSMVGVSMEDRPTYFASLFSRLQEMRTRVGRPHWFAMDEAHHLLPSDWQTTTITLPEDFCGMLLLTVHPEHVSPAILSRMDVLIVMGEKPRDTLAAFCTAVKEETPRVSVEQLEDAQALFWNRRAGEAPVVMSVALPSTEHRRHTRKYATGDLAPVKSFYFRGPEGELNLRAQNLEMFVQLAEGVDDDTWQFHLQNGDYSRWFREMIGDTELAQDAARVERDTGLSPAESRAAIASAIERRYTVPA
jgi:phosphoglycolate phosphatase-like HAD superfamily hydrolase